MPAPPFSMSPAQLKLRDDYLQSSTGYDERFPTIVQTRTNLPRFKAGMVTPPAVLDLPCAWGHSTEALRRLGFKPSGLDESVVAIQKAKAVHKFCQFYWGSPYNPGVLKNAVFDAIVAHDFQLYNSPYDAGTLQGTLQLMKYLRKGGLFVLLLHTNKSCLKKWDAWGNTYFQDPEDIARLFAQLGGSSSYAHGTIVGEAYKK